MTRYIPAHRLTLALMTRKERNEARFWGGRFFAHFMFGRGFKCST